MANANRHGGDEPRHEEGAFAHVDRPRVRARLRDALRYRVAMIVAPAGFGKSVAIDQSLLPADDWVRYDVPRNAGVAAFVTGLAHALDGVVPELQRSLASALDGARRSPSPGHELAAWAAVHLAPAEALIVVDDLHNAERDGETSVFLRELVDRTKSGPRWLFSSRSALELPVASWIAYGHCDLVVDKDDLCFTPAEARAAARVVRANVDELELVDVLGITEGWPVALAFALRTSTGARDLRNLSTSTREMIYRYLAEQVWNALDERARAFLSKMAFYPRVETRFAVAAGFDDGTAIADSLRARLAFVSIVDDGVFRLHDLFRDFVRARVRLGGEGAFRAAVTGAAGVLEGFGLLGEALTRYLVAGALADVQRIVAGANIRIFDSVPFDVVERAVGVLVASRRAESAQVQAVRASLESLNGRIVQAERWYEDVLRRAPEYDVPFQVGVTIKYAIMLFNQGRSEAIPLLDGLLARTDLTTPERSSVLSMLATSHALNGRFSDARARIREALDLADLCDDHVRARVAGRAAITAFYCADELEAERHAREAARTFTAASDFAAAARNLATLVSVLYNAVRLSEAATAAEEMVASATKGGEPETNAAGSRALLEIAALRGHRQRGLEIDASLRGFAYRGRLGELSYVHGMALLYGASGDFRKALSLLRADPSRMTVFSFERCLREAVSACLEAALGNHAAAASALANADAAIAHHAADSTPFRSDWALVERYSLLAIVLLHRKTQARKALRALRFRFPEHAGFDRAIAALVDGKSGEIVPSLEMLRRADLGGLADFVATLVSNYTADLPDESESVALTTAERQVLAAMVAGMSNQAIADERHRALNTVRVHVSSILRKLGVSSRAEAVALVTRARRTD